MVEKVRLTLWDIFSFFLTGFLLAIIISFIIVIYTEVTFNNYIVFLNNLSSSILLVLGPLLLILMGVVIEPLANYCDKYIFKYLFSWVNKQRDVHCNEEKVLEKIIKKYYLGKLGKKIDNPFHMCKEYVETKQLSTTYMTFLSRYGFYRNCSFLMFFFGIIVSLIECNNMSFFIFLFTYLLTSLFKKRSQDFYSYMAPSVYRAFLIDKVEWKKNNH